jgi:hypothetical protein
VSQEAQASSDSGQALLYLSIGIPGFVDSGLIWADVIMAIAGHQPSRRYYTVEVAVTAPQIPYFCTLAVVASARGSPLASIAWFIVAVPVVTTVHGVWGLVRTQPPGPSPPSSEPDYPGVLGSGAGTNGQRDTSSGRKGKELSLSLLSLSPTVIVSGRETTPGLALFGRF